MARARNIKPGFFKNEVLAELPVLVRLLFVGLWTYADREGRFEYRPKKIKVELLPYDEINIEESIQLLIDNGFLQKYEIQNITYIQVVNWSKHQNPHHKEVPSVIPSPEGISGSLIHSKVMHESSMNHEQANEIASCPTDSGFLIPDSGYLTTSTDASPKHGVSGGGHFFEIEMHGQRLTEGEWIYRNMMEHRRNKGWASKGAEDLQSLLTLYPNHMEQWRKWATLPIARRIAAFAYSAIKATPDNHFKLALKLALDGEGDEFMRYVSRAQAQVDSKDYFVRIS